MRWVGLLSILSRVGRYRQASDQLIGIRFVLLIRVDLRNLRVFWPQRREGRHYITEENGAPAAQKWRPMPFPLRIGG